jgi:hypothetical protein
VCADEASSVKRRVERWLTRPLPRIPFAATGGVLALIKLGIDRVIALCFGHPYTVLFYVSPVDAPLLHPSDDRAYWVTLAATTTPFIAVGLALTARRLRDAALSPWFALLFFVPFANLLFFLTMVLVPSYRRVPTAHAGADAPYREAPPPRPLPVVTRYPRLIAGVFGAVIGLGAMAVSVGLLRAYGVALTLGAPTIAGFATGAFYARLRPGTNFRGAALSIVIATTVPLAIAIILALEGLGCLFMFAPLVVLPVVAGAYVGFLAGHALPRRSLDATVAGSILVFLAILGVERVAPLPPLTPPPVETVLVVDAPPEVVWPLVTDLDDMPPPEDWAFRVAGIAYPVRARMHGEGLGARRTCELSTGAVEETVDMWRPGQVLGFTIDSQPDPMRERTLYDTVRQPHLDGYVRNVRGELQLEAMSGGRTRLTGKSWYTVRLSPEAYWRLWSDLFIRKIHLRVLGAIKSRAEARSTRLLVTESRPD